MIEKRRLSRKPLVGSLHIFSRYERQDRGGALITDMNEQGMRVISNRDLKPGDEVSLHFHLRYNWKCDYCGTIIYKAPISTARAYGIKFHEKQSAFFMKLF